MQNYNLFTSESVSEGHPDKMADQISDAVLDSILKDDPESRVAVETMVKTGMAIIAGEVRTNTYVDLEDVGSTPSQENVELARKYGVTATPVVVAVDDGGEFETYIGGLQITQNIRKIYDKYVK